MNNLTKEEQQKLLEFAKLLENYNPEYRMADVLKEKFLNLRKEVNFILKK